MGRSQLNAASTGNPLNPVASASGAASMAPKTPPSPEPGERPLPRLQEKEVKDRTCGKFSALAYVDAILFFSTLIKFFYSSTNSVPVSQFTACPIMYP